MFCSGQKEGVEIHRLLSEIGDQFQGPSHTPPPIPLHTGKNNGFPILDILGYLKNTPKNPKFGEVRQIPIREFPTKFPNWDLSHSSKFGIFLGIL